MTTPVIFFRSLFSPRAAFPSVQHFIMWNIITYRECKRCEDDDEHFFTIFFFPFYVASHHHRQQAHFNFHMQKRTWTFQNIQQLLDICQSTNRVWLWDIHQSHYTQLSSTTTLEKKEWIEEREAACRWKGNKCLLCRDRFFHFPLKAILKLFLFTILKSSTSHSFLWFLSSCFFSYDFLLYIRLTTWWLWLRKVDSL